MLDEIRALVEKHCHTLRDELSEIEACVDRIDNADARSDVLWQGVETTHKIKGRSGSIGFAKISAAAADLETVFRAAHEAGENEIAPKLKDELNSRFRALQSLVVNIRAEESSLYNAVFPGTAA